MSTDIEWLFWHGFLLGVAATISAGCIVLAAVLGLFERLDRQDEEQGQ